MSSLPRLRITYDHQIFVAQTYGGVSRYFCEIAHRISRRPEFRVQVVAPLFTNEFLRRSDVRRLGVFVPSIWGTHRVRSILSRTSAGWLIGATLPDIVHETYYRRDPPARHRGKTIVTVYDMIHERMPGSFPKSDRTSEHKRGAVDRADLVICISERTRNDLIEIFGVERERTAVTYLGCSHPGAGMSLGRSSPPPVKPFLLYVGARGPNKNFDGMLRAIASSAPLRTSFDIVAFGGGPLGEHELLLAERLGFKEGQVSNMSGGDAILQSMYLAAAALVYPSLYEGFGIPVLEAMSMGCPVVCSNASSLPEVGGEAVQYFNPADEHSMRTAIEQVAGSNGLRTLLRQKGLVRSASFTWERTATETVAAYRQVLGMRGV